MFWQLARRTPVLTATVRSPTEGFQKILRSSPSSASELEFPAELLWFTHNTADAPTYNGQNGSFRPTRAVFQQYVGVLAVLCANGLFSAGSSKSDAELGLDVRIF